MDTAALRIKFTPLLKKIGSDDSGSKCCIEIVPELSGYQNLNKISWKLDETFIEYKIPMTYKILIKKQELVKNENSEVRVYHSCVDLMQACSVANSDMAAGDVTRIFSDNFFLKHFANIDKCDLVVTKDLLSPREIENLYPRQRTASIQTLDCGEICYSSLSSQRPISNKSQETGITCKPTVITVAVHCNETSFVDKEESSNTICPEQRNQKITFINDDKSEINDTAAVEVFTNNLQNKLSLSPICSINTYDVVPKGKIYAKSNTSSFIFCDSFSKTNLRSDYESNVFDESGLSKEISEVPFSKSRQILQILRSKTNLTIKNISHNDSVDRNQNPTEFQKQIDKMHCRNFSSPCFHKVKNIDSNFNKLNNHENVVEQKYSFTIPNIVSHNNRKYKKYTRNVESREPLIAEERNEPSAGTNRIDNNKMIIFENGFKDKRFLLNMRVASFLQNLEREINPLRAKLYEIKVKCISLGLFRSEPKQTKNSIIYKSLPNVETQIESNKAKKSNRVVYTILFNG